MSLRQPGPQVQVLISKKQTNKRKVIYYASLLSCSSALRNPWGRHSPEQGTTAVLCVPVLELLSNVCYFSWALAAFCTPLVPLQLFKLFPWTWNKPTCPSTDEQRRKMWYIYTMNFI